MEVILKMTPIDWLIFWLSIGAYAPLIVGVIKNKNDKSQVFTTWILYLLLDLITMFSIKEKDGSYVILFGFSVGSFVMASVLFYQKRLSWTLLETTVTLLIVLCILSWYFSGPYLAIISGILSETIVGIYLIIRTYRNPVVKYNLNGYSIFLIVSIITMLSAKDFTLPQIGFATCETILNIIVIIPLYKKWKEEKI